MAIPPPLPPNRPTTKHRGAPPFNVVARDRSRESSSPAHSQTLSPRHSWASSPTVNESLAFQRGLHDRPPLPLPLPPSLSGSLAGSATLFPDEEDKFTLTELIDSYSSIFPLKVCVVKGFYGDRGEDCAIAVDECYNFHFVKRSKVVAITDRGKNKYVVPLNSAARFGILYELGTTVFSTVEDILNAKPLPQVVSVGTGYVGNSLEASVNKHEVLVVKGIDKGGRFRRKPATLKVFSVTKNMEKALTKDVFGKFSTDPYSTQMYLPEFLKHIQDPIPNKARLYLDFESDDPLPDYLTSESITLKRLYVETSIIASLLSEDETNEETSVILGEDTQTVDIPISLDIEVSVIPPAEEHDYEKLTLHTVTLLKTFDPASATTSHPVEEDEDGEDYSAVAQDRFFKSVRKGFEKEGLNIETPTKIRSFSRKGQRSESSSSREGSVDLDGYEDMTVIEKIRAEAAWSSQHEDRTPSPPLPYEPTSPSRPSFQSLVPPSPPQRPPHTLSPESELYLNNVSQVDSEAITPQAPRKRPSSASSVSHKSGPLSLNGRPGPPPAEKSGPPPAERSGPRPAERSGTPPAERSGPRPAERSGTPPAERSGTPPAGRSGRPLPERSGPPPAERSGPPLPERSDPPPAERSGPPPAGRSGPPLATRPPTRKQSSDTLKPEYPSRKRESSPLLPGIAESPTQPASPSTETYETIDHNCPAQNDISASPAHHHHTPPSASSDTLQSSLSDLTARVKWLEKQKYITGGKTGSSDVHGQVEKARLSTEKLEREFQDLQEGMKELGERVTELASRVESSHREPATTNDTTNSDLETLDCSQVQKMLELMGMTRHQKSFAEAGVDGTILVECDDVILQEELSVNARLDRIKLLQVISGKRSIQGIFQKSYVAFQPRN